MCWLVYIQHTKAKINCDTASGFWIFKNLHQHHPWTKLSYINFSLIHPAFPFNNHFLPFISYCLILYKMTVPFQVPEGFHHFLHSSQTLLQKKKKTSETCKHSVLFLRTHGIIWCPHLPEWSKKWSHEGYIITNWENHSFQVSLLDICAQVTPPGIGKHNTWAWAPLGYRQETFQGEKHEDL